MRACVREERDERQRERGREGREEERDGAVTCGMKLSTALILESFMTSPPSIGASSSARTDDEEPGPRARSLGSKAGHCHSSSFKNRRRSFRPHN